MTPLLRCWAAALLCWALLSASSVSSTSPAGLVHHLPLQGSYVDVANASAVVVVQGNAAGCASFPTLGGVVVWAQSCGVGSGAVTLQLPSPVESGEVSLSTYVHVAAWQAETTFFFACNNVVSAALDCVEMWYDSVYGVLVARLNQQGTGVGVQLTLPVGQWFHIAATYSPSTQLLTVYHAGVAVGQVAVSHTTAAYGAPVLAGEGSGDAAPLVGAFSNFRVYDVALASADVATLNATDYPGASPVPPAASPIPQSSPAFSSSSTSSPALFPSSIGAPVSVPSVSSAPGLVHWLPLQGSYVDVANASAVVVVQGNAAGCASFPTLGGVVVWAQSCGVGSGAVTLQLPSPVESGEVSLSTYVHVAAWQAETTFFFACNNVVSAALDCVEMWYDSVYGVLVARLNQQGTGVGVQLTLPVGQWFHIAATYSPSTQLLTVYHAGVAVGQVAVSHTTAAYGAPVLAGEGSGDAAPLVGAFSNFRVYDVALASADVATLNATDYPGASPVPPAASPIPQSSPAFSSSSTSSPALFPSSIGAPVSVPSVSSAPGLVHWLPLQGSYVDVANASAVVVVQGNAAGCASFPTLGGVVVWAQSCGVGSGAVTLQLPSPVESGEVSLSTYVHVAAWQAETTFFFACNNVVSAALDCVEMWYDSVYGVLVARLNQQGTGVGVQLTLPVGQWFHIAATYSPSTQLLTVYHAGVAVGQVAVSHTTAAYGAPVLAGEGSGDAAPLVGAFSNFRVYDVALASADVAALTITDYPGYVAPPTTAPNVPTSTPPTPQSSSTISSSTFSSSTHSSSIYSSSAASSSAASSSAASSSIVSSSAASSSPASSSISSSTFSSSAFSSSPLSSPVTSAAAAQSSAPLARFLAALPSASTSLVRVSVIGDSIAWGLYASHPMSTSWVGVLRGRLQAVWGDGGSGFTSVTYISGYASGSNYAFGPDVAVSLVGAWGLEAGSCGNVKAYDDLNAYEAFSSTPGVTASFVVRGAQLQLFYVTQPSGAPFSVQLDGQLLLPQVNTQDANTASVSLTIHTTAAWHTLTVTHIGTSAQQLLLQGVDATNPQGIVVDLYATPGQTAQNLACSNNTIRQAGGTDGLRPAQLVLVELGINDAYAGVSAAEFGSILDSIMTHFVGVDAVFMRFSFGIIESVIGQMLYPQYLAEVPSSFNLLYDVGTLIFNNTWTEGVAIGYFGYYGDPGVSDNNPGSADATHPSDYGHLVSSNLLCPALDLNC